MYTLSRPGTQVLAIFTALIVIALCFEVCAQSFDGTWSGPTSQVNRGTPKTISFTIVNRAITSIRVEFVDSNRCGTFEGFLTQTFQPPQGITGSTFSVIAAGGAPSGASVVASITGTFSSPTSASGNIVFTFRTPSLCLALVSTQ